MRTTAFLTLLLLAAPAAAQIQYQAADREQFLAQGAKEGEVMATPRSCRKT